MSNKAYLDSCCLIYLIEDVPVFSQQMRQRLLNHINIVICVSPLVRLEVLVKPLSDKNVSLVADYEYFLQEQHWLTINDKIFELALQLRARYRIKIRDALHLATALHHNCAEFWTNDDRLQTVAANAGCVARNMVRDVE